MSRAKVWAATGILGAAGVIAIATVAARVFGFGRTVVLGQTLGETCLGAAYASANSIPNVVFEIVAGGALAGLVVPLLAGAAQRRDEALIQDTTRALVGWMLVVLLPAALLVAVFAKPIVQLVLGSDGSCADDETAEVASAMLRVFAVQIPIYGLAVIAQGVLNAHHRFLSPALAPLISSIFVIAALLAYGAVAGDDLGSLDELTNAGFALLAWGTTLGVFMLWVSQVPALARSGLLTMRPNLRFPADVAPRARRLAYAGVATVSAQWVAFVVALRLSNDRGAEGASLVFTLAWAMFLLPWAVLAFPVVTSVFPRLSAAYEHRRDHEFAAIGGRALRTVFAGGCLGAAGIAATAAPVANLMLLGAPGVSDTTSLERTLTAMAPAVLGYSVLGYSGRILFARHRGRDASWLIAGAWSLFVVLALWWTAGADRDRVLSLLGLSMSVALILGGIAALSVVLRILGGGVPLRAFASTFTAGLLASVLGRLLANLVIDQWSGAVPWWGSLLQAGVVGALTVAAFASVLWLFDGDDLRALVRAVRSGRRGASSSSSESRPD